MVRFLETLTGYKSIASSGYRRGLKILIVEGQKIAKALETDKTFLVKFLYLLDCAFQQFCENLLEEATGNSPIRTAYRRGLDTFQTTLIDTELRSFLNIGSVPTLSLPSILVTSGGGAAGLVDLGLKKGGKGGKLPPGKGKDEMEKVGGTKDPLKSKTDDPEWFIANPGVIWSIPVGRNFGEIFGKGKTENQSGFPQLRHHVSNKNKNMCLKYQAAGSCKAGRNCPMAHMPPAAMGSTDRALVEKRFGEVYGS